MTPSHANKAVLGTVDMGDEDIHQSALATRRRMTLEPAMSRNAAPTMNGILVPMMRRTMEPKTRMPEPGRKIREPMRKKIQEPTRKLDQTRKSCRPHATRMHLECRRWS
jgi:hypothetical protein